MQESAAPDDVAGRVKTKTKDVNDRWTVLLSDWEERQHEVNDAVAKTQGFRVLLADTLQWIEATERDLASQPDAGFTTETLRGQLDSLKAIQSDVDAHRPHVESVRRSGRRTVEAGLGDGDLERDLGALEVRWPQLETALDERRNVVETRWKLAESFEEKCAELNAYLFFVERELVDESATPWRVRAEKKKGRRLEGLAADLDEHRGLIDDVLSIGSQLDGDESVRSATRAAKARWDSDESEVRARVEGCETVESALATFERDDVAFDAWLREADAKMKKLKKPAKSVETLQKQMDNHKVGHIMRTPLLDSLPFVCLFVCSLGFH